MDPLFQVHKLNEEGLAAAKAIANHFDELIGQLGTICPESREYSICKTKLEEACFFSKKSIANKREFQE